MIIKASKNKSPVVILEEGTRVWGRDSPSCRWRAAEKRQCHWDPGRRASSLARCSSTSSSSHTCKDSFDEETHCRTCSAPRESVSSHNITALPVHIKVRSCLWLVALCGLTDYVHVLGGMLRFGHPVSTLDFVVEAGIHYHARVRGATLK